MKGIYYVVDKNIYLHQSFDYEVPNTLGYYEYRALHIEDPEEYYDFL